MQREKELEQLILKHKALYYAGHPEISDFEYDKLEEELKVLNPESFVLSVVGTDSGSGKVEHSTKMLSLNKVYTLEELIKWKGSHELVSLFKIDGMSCSLIYDEGQLILGKTRGDGNYGENITEKIKWIGTIPKYIDGFSGEVRGEIYCTEEDFIHLAKQMQNLGLERPTSQRNIVAGLIGRKDNVELSRFLTFTPFDLIDEEEYVAEMDKYHQLSRFGFNTIEVELCKTKEDIERELRRCSSFMQDGNYLIDGQVFIINDVTVHQELGATAHHPRFKMAYKFRGETAQARIDKISWSVSRNGILTPVANIKPVTLSGASISRVTLHNYGLVNQFKLKSGDIVEIVRSGEVIPKFLQVIKSSENDFTVPTSCPSCGGSVEIKDIRIYCMNEGCPGRELEVYLNFVQKIGIMDLSSKRLEQMINAGLLKRIGDLYRLTKVQLLELEKTKDKLADKLLEQIEKSKGAQLITFLSALGIPGGAYNKCEKVVSAGYDSIEKIQQLTVEQLCLVEGFAEKSATEFVQGIQKRKNLIDDLLSVGFNPQNVSKQDQLCFCITGGLSEKRSVIEGRIRDRGHKVVSTVTNETTHLVCNTPSSSSKYKKAEKLNLPIITEAKLKELLK